MRAICSLFLTLCASALCADVPAEAPASFATSGGSRLAGMILLDRPFTLRPEKGAPQKLDVAAIKSVTLGQRADPNQENEALNALGDMQSDQFEVREKALVRLRALGRAAIKALRQASSAPDAEVATRAKALLAELTLANAAGQLTDQITLRDGTTLNGELTPNEFTLRSRWGILKFPSTCLESIEFLKAEDLNAAALVPAGGAPLVSQPQPAPPLDAAAERWEIAEEQRIGAPVGRTLSGLAILDMDRAPNPDAREKKLIELKAGDRLEDAYAAWGALLRGAPGSELKAADTELISSSGKLGIQLQKSDLSVAFVVPGSYSAKNNSSRAGGVNMVGAVIKSSPRFSVGLAAYDRAGRQLAEVYNTGGVELPPGAGVNASEFLGIRSKVPIARLRFFRAGDARGDDLVLDDIVFDRVVSVDRAPDIASVWLASGERLAGRVKAATLEKGMQLQPEFFPAGSAPVQIAADEIDRYEPARQTPEQAKGIIGGEKTKKRASLGTPHGILLQSGESFRALFVKIDENDAQFMLPGGAELKLPRALLRKIDLNPAPPEPGELPGPIAVAENEKPGVDYRRRDDNKKEGDKKEGDKKEGEKKEGEKPDDKKKNDVLQTTQELKAMEGKIVEADIFSGDLTIEDDNGPWTVGIALVKTLVFPPDPNAKKAVPKFRDWVLTLREGSRFEIVLTGISPDAIAAEMAGGSVALPSHVVDSIQRQKRQ
jgi:hypothetical protein